MQWIVLLPIVFLVVASVAGTDLMSPRFVRSLLYLALVYVCWSFVLNTSFSAYLLLALHMATSPAFLSSLSNTHCFLRNYGMMMATLLAMLWLLRRTMQVLQKPVPDLINILGMDFPDPPDLTLAGIRSDTATLTWAPPPPNRPVQRFSIEVNGVHVGATGSQETAITVTGLKPSHFYNLRVIAVSSNNFKAGSRIIRIETHATDGRPNVDPRLVHDNYFEARHRPRGNADAARNNSDAKLPFLESANLADTGLGPSANLGPSGRRNTVGRKHSPSTAAVEPPPIVKDLKSDSANEGNVAELTAKLGMNRRCLDEVRAATVEEEEGHKATMEDLLKEKELQQSILKERSETSRKLKSDMAKGDSAAQDAHKAMTNKKRTLEKAQTDKAKMEEDIRTMKDAVEQMRRDRHEFDSERTALQGKHDVQKQDLQEITQSTRAEISRLDKELKDKRERFKALEAENKTLPLAKDDQAWKDTVVQAKHELERTMTRTSNELGHLHRRARELERTLVAVQTNPQHALALFHQSNPNPPPIPEYEYAPPLQNQPNRRNRANTVAGGPIVSPTTLPPPTEPQPSFPTATSSFAATRTTAPPLGLVPLSEVPYMHPIDHRLNNGYDDRDSQGPSSGEPPLSPGAAAFLPQGILADDDHGLDSPATMENHSPFGPHTSMDVPRSPSSSSQSLGHISSPRGSANNLTFASDLNERTSNLLRSSPHAPPARTSTTHGFSNFFTGWQRNRGGKSVDEGGPALGTLKAGQSQSFPRKTDEDAFMARRRASLTSPWTIFNRNSAGPDIIEGSAAASRLGRPFNSSVTGFRTTEVDPSSPRPASMASYSSDIPRPSTDSGPLWAGLSFGELATPSHSRVWGHSRTASRRTSVHGAPTTNLASEEDIILGKEDLLKPEASPSQVGVIGSRPKSKLVLNPTAPSFMAFMTGGRKGDKDDNDSDGPVKSKVKSKDKAKDKKDKKDKKNKDPPLVSTPDTPEFHFSVEHSPPDSRLSRDGFSVGGRTSVSMSESHESLSLDVLHSNTPSEANAVSPATAIKDQENVVKKLFRKGSASKFSLSGKFSKDPGVGLFKKGPSSIATNGSERAERSSISVSEADDSVDDAAAVSNLAKSFESVASSPSLGPNKNRWSMFRKKGNKEKESLDLDRDEAGE